MNSLSIAQGIRRRNMKKPEMAYAKGGMVHKKNMMVKPSSIVAGIMAKKMADGGMVESEDLKELYESGEDFLTADEQDEPIDATYPDPDGIESDQPLSGRKKILHKIMMSLN